MTGSDVDSPNRRSLSLQVSVQLSFTMTEISYRHDLSTVHSSPVDTNSDGTLFPRRPGGEPGGEENRDSRHWEGEETGVYVLLNPCRGTDRSTEYESSCYAIL